jgi:hypothetical protein
MLQKLLLISKTNGGATSRTSSISSMASSNTGGGGGGGGGLPPAPPNLQGRNISADTTSTTCSRDDLRLHIEKRRKSLMQHEHAFLDNLCVHGNDIEVQLAFDRLTDDSIFFEHHSPLSTASTESNSCFNEEEDDDMDNDDGDNDLGASGTTSASDPLALPKENSDVNQPSTVTLDTNPMDVVTEGKGGNDPPSKAAIERPSMAGRRASSIGSLRRLEALEARKQNNELHGHMWKAHATGLALTQNASRQSLNMRRESSSNASGGSGSGSSGGNKMLRAPRRGSTTSSSLNCKVGGGGAIFRRGSLEGASSSTNSVLLRKSQKAAASAALGLPPRRMHQRSRSMSLQAPPRMSLFQDSPGNMSESTIRSNTSRKSVTFNVDPSQSQPTRGTGKPMFRRSNSDVLPPHVRLDDEVATTTKIPKVPPTAVSVRNDPEELPLPSRAQLPATLNRLESNASSVMSIPAIPHAQPIRSESMGSASDVPSIQRATMIRSDSLASSIPSLHHGHALNSSGDDESPTASSTPGLLHANLLGRGESNGSIPSLHYAHHVHGDDSVATSHAVSIPSLHHAHPIRSESIGSIPSLHHAHRLSTEDQEGGIHAQILQDNAGTPADIDVLQDAKANWLTQYYGTSDDIAASWMAASNSEITTTDIIPLNVTIPSTATTTTITTSTTQSTAEELDEPHDNDDQQIHCHKPVLMRLASRSGCYEGEGVEVTELEQPPQRVHHTDHEEFFQPMDGSGDSESDARNVFRNMKSLGDISVRTASSYDDAGESSEMGYGRRHDDIFRNIQRSLSDQDMSNLFLGSSGTYAY